MVTLAVLDDNRPVAFGFDDMVRYHGRASIGGLALGFKVLERGLALLADGPLDRRSIVVETAFDGPGTRDAFELVTRAVTGHRYRVVPDLAGPGALEAPQGHFVFRLSTAYAAATMELRAGIVTDEFVQLVRKHPRTPPEEAHLVSLKELLASDVMGRGADAVFDADDR